MNHIIIGAGAIGMLMASRLSLSGQDVWLWTRSQEQAVRIGDGGIKLAGASGETEKAEPRLVRVQASSFFLPSAELAVGEREEMAVWLTVKQTHLNDAFILKLRQLLPPGALLLCMQNGIGHIERLKEALDKVEVIPVITTEGALTEKGGTLVRHTGQGQIHIAESTSAEAFALQKKLMISLKKAGITAFLSKQLDDRIYQKLLINSVINPLTALYQVRNGELPEDPVRLKLMRALYEEGIHIVRAAGMTCSGKEWEMLLEVCRNTALNESSMFRDVRSGRETEIDSINGGLAALGREFGLPAPLNAAMLSMVKALGFMQTESAGF
ncbi:ketopantoate reductase family protein [Paenibacillus pinihumi]|uniref:ketopantoate reductase family protein n=1 Tax=Paenibacillus pinihumi TaxID=669462 RepID=UPI0004081D6B|nr:2-dehydropantoate 2-reductase [Paenibacillus pinihumi]